RSRPLLYLTVAAIPYLVLVLVLVALTALFAGALVPLGSLATDDAGPAVDRVVASAGALVTYGTLALVAVLLMSLVQSGSLVAAAAARYMGKETSVGAALGAGLRASPRLLGMGIVAVVAVTLVWTVLIIGMAISHQWWSVLIGVVAGLVATFYLAASWMVSPAIVVLESAGPVASLTRAWRLAEGGRWRILGLILLLVILQAVVSSLLSFFVVASLVTDRTVQLVVQQAVNLLATIAWAPVYWGTFAVLYYDLRVRKEALDLQLAAEALPREV
ncbi:MAG: hypothetical protein KGQ88_08295, partial [Chloroflexi bacterium]|nr:hypothetical protein [Chloroflexota bacterium]